MYGKTNSLTSGVTIGNRALTGNCVHCNASFNDVEAYCIPCNDRLPNEPDFGIGMVHICDNCFSQLPVSTILQYCQEHRDRWDTRIDMEIIEHNIKWLKDSNRAD